MTETPTRHSILTKHKDFRDKATGKLASNSTKLISETNEAPIDVDAHEASQPIVLREEDDDADAGAVLDQIPAAGDQTTSAQPPRRSKRQRTTGAGKYADSDSEDLFVGSDEDGPSPDTAPIEIDSDADDAPPPKRRRKRKASAQDTENAEVAGDDDDDKKKKMAIDISFEGFAIYGRVLCLVVKKREGALRTAGAGTARAAASEAAGSKPAGQAMMENWISSTQMPNPGAEEQAEV